MKYFIFMLYFFTSLLYAGDYENAIKDYVDFPNTVKEEVSYLMPYDKSYLPYNVCNEIQNFEITNLEERINYYYDHKDGL